MNKKDGRKKKAPKIPVLRRALPICAQGQRICTDADQESSVARKLQDEFGNLQEQLRQWVAEAVSVNHLKHH